MTDRDPTYDDELRLAAIVAEHWQERGQCVKVRVERMQGRPTIRGKYKPLWGTRSNMVNGIPPPRGVK